MCAAGIWKIIKGWLDPVVAGKVHFTNSPTELETYIPRDHMIKELGGDDTWVYSYIEPSPEENKSLADTTTRDRLQTERADVVRDFEAATREWIGGPPADNSLRAKRNELAERLRAGYWELDRYVRARCLLDRTGIIGKDGRIDFYHPKEPTAAASEGASGPEDTDGVASAHGADDVD